MNIRKIYAALCCLLLVTMSVNAQQYMNVSGNKNSNSIPTLLVKYATLKGDKDWFKITNGSAEVKDHSISASCTVVLATSRIIKKLATSPEIGVCYSSTNTTPTISDEIQSLGKELGNYSYILNLIPGTTYYYRVYVKLGEEVFYGDVCNAKIPGTRLINGHLFVDLGLPSGLLWAETNIGAETAADVGNYYAWGETTTKDTYNESNYKYYDKSSGSYTKYTSSDGKTVLENSDDAAYVNWGSPCRMPTKTECQELRNTDNCTWTWTSKITSSNETVDGYVVTSKKNGNSIFFPGEQTYWWYKEYWLNIGYGDGYAAVFEFNDSDVKFSYSSVYSSQLVRPVAEP